MNGFADHGLDEAAFGEKASFTNNLRTFDAFPKTKPTYTRRSSTGGYTTLVLIIISTILSISELLRWYHGRETHLFSVEKGVSHDLQINIDIVIPMKCDDLHINVQDASGDRILAGDALNKDRTDWYQWVNSKGVYTFDSGDIGRHREEEEDTHPDHVVGEVRRKKKKRKFKRTPRGFGRNALESCRIYGSLEGNKVQGDFHITARGHGYMEFGEHLDHSAFNFTHLISELSFGPHYPSLLNPLDHTLASTLENFYKFQYYLSVVPTVYTTTPSPKHINPYRPDPTADKNTIYTNQYAATSQSHSVAERAVPGIFFKFDIEPILLTVRAERDSFLRALVRIVNLVSGVLVGGGWCYQLFGWGKEVIGGKRRNLGNGVLTGKSEKEYDDEDH